MPDFAAARLNMVECQLRPNGVTDERLLDAMGSIPRERFLPDALQGIAYTDEDIRLPGDGFLMEPLVLGRLLQLAMPTKDDRALVIDGGPGYAAVVLARLCHDLVLLQEQPATVEAIVRRLPDIGIRNARVVAGRLTDGYPERAPYDVILLGGAVEEIPPAITDQLAEGGRLVTVLRPAGEVGRLLLMARTAGLLESRFAADAATLPLPAFARRREFAF